MTSSPVQAQRGTDKRERQELIEHANRERLAEQIMAEWNDLWDAYGVADVILSRERLRKQLRARDEEIAGLTDRLEKWQLNFGHIDPDAARDAALAALQEKSRDAIS